MTQRRRSDPVPIGDVVPGVLRKLKPKQGSLLAEMRRRWSRAVGPGVAAKTRVAGLREGVLEVDIASSALKHHLSTFGRDEILGKLNEGLAGKPVRGLRFRVGGDL